MSDSDVESDYDYPEEPPGDESDPESVDNHSSVEFWNSMIMSGYGYETNRHVVGYIGDDSS